MDQALELLPSDYWRWWLLSNAPESSDSDFSWAAFQAGCNKDLNDVLGNFVSRVTKFCRSKYSEAFPSGGTPGDEEAALVKELDARLAAYGEAMEAIEIRKAAAELRGIWVAGNEYITRAAPWTVFKTDPDQAAMVIRTALNLMALYVTVSRPFIPDAADSLAEAIGADLPWPENAETALKALPEGHSFTVPENLFRKIDDGERSLWEEKFGGVSET